MKVDACGRGRPHNSRSGDRRYRMLRDELAHSGGGLVFEMEEANDDIGYLDAGVVDVVLDVDFLAGGAEQADEGVAEDGVAEVSDVGGFVGIDAGVLDH